MGANDVPIIGQSARLTVVDFEVIAPNQVQLVPNGLDMGQSVAHLRVTHIIKAKQTWVPLTEHQLDDLGAMINAVLTQVNPTDYPKRGTHGIN